MSDTDLRNHVLMELEFEPSLDAVDIGVTVKDGVVTLAGHAPSYAQKVAAETAARRVKGVQVVVQKIEVRPVRADSDEQLARRALDLLDWDVTIPHGAVKPDVTGGLITLTGEVEWEYQRRAAAEAVRRLAGVIGVINNISLRPRVSPTDVRERIQRALERYADLEAHGVHVEVTDGKVVLTGKVKSWGERDVLQAAAWSAPGVRAVEDKVTVG